MISVVMQDLTLFVPICSFVSSDFLSDKPCVIASRYGGVDYWQSDIKCPTKMSIFLAVDVPLLAAGSMQSVISDCLSG